MTVAAKRDRRDLPTYGPLEAARCLALPASTVRVWSVGLPYRKGDRQRFMQPVIEPATRSPLALSFWNVVELYVLATIRRRHEVSMHEVRRALAYVREKLGKDRPLIDEEFLTDGVSLFVERYGDLINASASGQNSMQMVLRESLDRIERDDRGLALRVFPWLREPASEPRAVEIDPFRASGRLVIAHTGIPTEAVAERFRAGEKIAELAADYGLNIDQIETALRWEQCGLAA
jgi:uncharacterized protein (DUF433 family)